MSELKPCPFCGGEVHFDREEIFCDCGITLKIEPFYYEEPLELSFTDRWKNARKEAIEAWNRRASE